MNSVVTNALFDLYSTGFVENIYDTLAMILSATKTAILDYHVVTLAFNTFSGIMASLIIIFFYLDLMDQMQRELFSFEKLIVAFIRLVVCAAVCACFPEICTLIIDFGIGVLAATHDAMKGMMESGTQLAIFIADETEKTTKSLFTAQMAKIYPGGASGSGIIKQIRYILEHPVWSIEAFVVMLVAAITKLIAYFIGISTAIIFIARLFFAPIGIVNIYRGEQSSGMRYFRTLLASSCTFAAMLAVVFAAALLSHGLMSDGALTRLGLLNSDDAEYLDYGIEVHIGTNGDWVDTNGDPLLEQSDYLEDDQGTVYDYIHEEKDENGGTHHYYYPPYLFVLDISDEALQDQDVRDGLEKLIADPDDGIFTLTRKYWDSMKVLRKNGASYGSRLKARSMWFQELGYAMAGEDASADDAKDELLDLLNSAAEGGDLDPSIYQAIYDPYFAMALNFRMVLVALIPQIAAIAGMAGATRIINDAFGVRGE